MKRFKITYTETLTKTSIISAEDEFFAGDRFEDNEDTQRETISSFREINNIEEL